jgi:hypothetical protein
MNKKTNFLYRIIKFEHLLDMFESKTLYFARPAVWDDPYELRIDHPAMGEVFAQCWCRRGVSDAMWRIYSPNHFGVRIKVRRKELSEQLAKAKEKVPYKNKKIGAVKYKRQSEIDIEHKHMVTEHQENYQPLKALDALMLKRNAFNHEAETRVLIYAKNIPTSSNGIRIPISPHSLIETVLADPRMPDAVYKAFSSYVKGKVGFKGRFGKSKIYTTNAPLKIGYDDDEI